MKIYKKGISLIVLVITILVLAILATAVIVSLSNTNIIRETNKTTFKSDMANLKTAYELYVASEMIYDINARGQININKTSEASTLTEIFGNNVKDEYKPGMQIVHGELMYKTTDTEEQKILKELNMQERTAIPTSLKIGDLVEYIPETDPNGSYPGVEYIKDTDTTSETYNLYIESPKTYKPGNIKWVYLGKDENGNVLLTSKYETDFSITIGGQAGYVNGPDKIDMLCDTLYSNSIYAKEIRNMKIEDVNRTLGYNGPFGSYRLSGAQVPTLIAKTIKELETELGKRMIYRLTPGLPDTKFEDYFSNLYSYEGRTYKDTTQEEYKVIFPYFSATSYWLSSRSAYANFDDNKVTYHIRVIGVTSRVTNLIICNSNDTENMSQTRLRPVIVLNSNIQFGEKNADGAWTLVEM